LVDFVEGVWGVFIGITGDKDKNKAMICKPMQAIYWSMILLVCQIFFTQIDEKVILYQHSARSTTSKVVLLIQISMTMTVLYASGSLIF